MPVLDIMSSNAGSLTLNNRIRGIQHFLREQAIDILAVQEIHLTAKDISNFKHLNKNISVISCNETSDARGVAVFCNDSVLMKNISLSQFLDAVPSILNIESRHLQLIKVEKDTINFILVNVHTPNNVQERCKMLNTISEIIALLDKPVILTGDWNNVENAVLNRLSRVDYIKDTSIKALQNLTDISNTVDAFRQSNAESRVFTFRRGDRVAARLDRIYVDKFLMSLATNTYHKVGIGADHTHGPVITLSTANRIEKDKETWRMNNSHLNNNKLCRKLSELIVNSFSLLSQERDCATTWSLTKL